MKSNWETSVGHLETFNVGQFALRKRMCNSVHVYITTTHYVTETCAESNAKKKKKQIVVSMREGKKGGKTTVPRAHKQEK